MRRRLAFFALAALAGTGATLAAALPAHAATSPVPTVRVGKTGCGQTQVYVNGKPVFAEVECPPQATS